MRGPGRERRGRDRCGPWWIAGTTARSAEKDLYCYRTGSLITYLYLTAMRAVLAVGALLVLLFLPGDRSAVGETRVSPRSNEVKPAVHLVRPR